MKKNLFVLGIDASTSCTGYSIIKYNGKNFTLVTYGKIRPDENLEYLDKCRFIYNKLDEVMTEYSNKVTSIAIEQPNTSVNMKNTRILCGLHGILRFMLWIRYNITPTEINTKTLKKSISGNGDAGKQEVVNAVNKLFKTKFIFTTSQSKANKGTSDDDIADSIGAAYSFIIKDGGLK